MKNKYVLTIKAEDSRGLLHLVTGILNRKLIPIVSLTAAPTDLHDIVLITIEIQISENALQPLLYKLENIVEVFVMEVIPYDQAICQRSAWFQWTRKFYQARKLVLLPNGNHRSCISSLTRY